MMESTIILIKNTRQSATLPISLVFEQKTMGLQPQETAGDSLMLLPTFRDLPDSDANVRLNLTYRSLVRFNLLLLTRC